MCCIKKKQQKNTSLGLNLLFGNSRGCPLVPVMQGIIASILFTCWSQFIDLSRIFPQSVLKDEVAMPFQFLLIQKLPYTTDSSLLPFSTPLLVLA